MGLTNSIVPRCECRGQHRQKAKVFSSTVRNKTSVLTVSVRALTLLPAGFLQLTVVSVRALTLLPAGFLQPTVKYGTNEIIISTIDQM